ncbi:unnamed protein product, partial [Timema podura]|nr:unnamed protein product [Timema podura]
MLEKRRGSMLSYNPKLSAYFACISYPQLQRPEEVPPVKGVTPPIFGATQIRTSSHRVLVLEGNCRAQGTGENNGPVIIASPAGGTDIENVATSSPHLIKTIPVDIEQGVTDEMSKNIAKFLDFKGSLIKEAATQIKQLWQLFLNVDAVQLEINPLVETSNGDVIAVDAKIIFDDNAKFRHKDIYSLEDETESDPKEIEAAKHNLNYIAMSGNIGCLVNGAGLAMATMDIIKLYGKEPANFLDVGGNVNEEQVLKAFQILTSG